MAHSENDKTRLNFISPARQKSFFARNTTPPSLSPEVLASSESEPTAHCSPVVLPERTDPLGTIHPARPCWPRHAGNRRTRLISGVAAEAPEMEPASGHAVPFGDAESILNASARDTPTLKTRLSVPWILCGTHGDVVCLMVSQTGLNNPE
ncbi:Hypothetical protein SMAX5B_001449 [Scophthalmus maximus]|uniref:Uncharacterized protein n=1 Tax=Scophthalmus maximus TaxID=52904 RepID=A0A2U9B0X3_SCOMX|nr:Hypothetical protein SMAX5B_001449 [Scophthalmus maximus]